MYYRFNSGVFIEADSFTEAKAIFIDRLKSEEEDPKRWAACTCLGPSHRIGCPEMGDEIPY